MYKLLIGMMIKMEQAKSKGMKFFYGSNVTPEFLVCNIKRLESFHEEILKEKNKKSIDRLTNFTILHTKMINISLH